MTLAPRPADAPRGVTHPRGLLVPVPHDDASASDRPVGELSYEQARDELVAVVARLEAGGETLEGSLALWERGEALAARCLEWLDGARVRLDAARGNDETTDVPGDGDGTDP